MSRRRLLAFALGLIAAAPVFAQKFPSGPVRIVVPFPAGGATDVLGRVLSIHLQNLWGPPVVSEYRPGAEISPPSSTPTSANGSSSRARPAAG